MARYGIILGVALGLVMAKVALASPSATLAVEIVGPSKVWCSGWTCGFDWEDNPCEYPPDYSRFTAESSYELSGDTLEELEGLHYEVMESWGWEIEPAKADWCGPDEPFIDIYCPGVGGTYNTISVTYTVTLSAWGIGRIASFQATDSMQYQVCDWFITQTVDRTTICAGAIDSDVHKTDITVDIFDGFDPVAGARVNLDPDYLNEYWPPPYYCSAAPSVTPKPAYTDCNGHADLVLTSGDGVRVVPFRLLVDLEHRGTTNVTFEAPTTTFATVDPETDEPLDYFLADGEAQLKVIVTETQGEMPVDGHALTWRFRFWDIEKDPDVDEPDYIGTGEAPYGSVSPVTGTTDAAGQHHTIYTSGTVDGWIEFEAIDGSVYEWH